MSQSLLTTMLDTVADGVVVLRAVRDDHGEPIDFEWAMMNPAAEELLGVPSKKLIGRRLTVSAPIITEIGLLARYLHIVRTGVPLDFEFAVADGDERWYKLRAARFVGDAIDGLVVVYRDTTSVQQSAEEVSNLRRRQRKLEQLALHDPLTGLANRTLLHTRLEHGIDRLARHLGTVAVFFIDLDAFKKTNDALGHAAGDELLVEVAARLRAAARPYDTVARIGGDEFVIVCEEVNSEVDLDAIARRLVRVCHTPIIIQGEPVSVSASLGVAITDSPAVEATQLIADADVAMYRAKTAGRARIKYFDPDLDARMALRDATGSDLVAALGNDELDVVFEPILDANNDELFAVDARLSWHHHSGVSIGHDVLIGMARDTNALTRVHTWFLDHAVEQFAQMDRDPQRPSAQMLVINLGEELISDAEFPGQLLHLLADHHLEPNRLGVAIDYLTGRPDLILGPLRALEQLGVKIVRDGVGAPSQMYYLPGYPVHYVRLDASITAPTADPDALRIVHLVARQHHKPVIAPAITTVEQLDAMRHFGSAYVQGPFIAGRAHLGTLSSHSSQPVRSPT